MARATPAQLSALLSAAILVPPEVFARMTAQFGLPSEKQAATFAILQALGLIPGVAAAAPANDAQSTGASRRWQTKIGEETTEIVAASARDAAEVHAAEHVTRLLKKPREERLPMHLTVEVREGDGAPTTVRVAIKIGVTAEAHG